MAELSMANRTNWISNSMTTPLWINSCIATWKASNGSCITTIEESHLGAGSTIITMRQGYPVCLVYWRGCLH